MTQLDTAIESFTSKKAAAEEALRGKTKKAQETTLNELLSTPLDDREQALNRLSQLTGGKEKNFSVKSATEGLVLFFYTEDTNKETCKDYFQQFSNYRYYCFLLELLKAIQKALQNGQPLSEEQRKKLEELTKQTIADPILAAKNAAGEILKKVLSEAETSASASTEPPPQNQRSAIPKNVPPAANTPSDASPLKDHYLSMDAAYLEIFFKSKNIPTKLQRLYNHANTLLACGQSLSEDEKTNCFSREACAYRKGLHLKRLVAELIGRANGQNFSTIIEKYQKIRFTGRHPNKPLSITDHRSTCCLFRIGPTETQKQLKHYRNQMSP